MALTPIEIIALILIVIGVIKMLVLFVKPVAWMNFAKKVYKRPPVVRIVSLILAAIVLWYLLTEITIVQIFAVMAFVALLFLIGLAPDINSLMAKYRAQIKRGRLWQENWLYTLIWIVLMVWALVVLFA